MCIRANSTRSKSGSCSPTRARNSSITILRVTPKNTVLRPMQIQLPRLRTDSKSMTSRLSLKSACKSSSSKPKSIKCWQLRVSTPLMSPKTKVYNRTPTIRPSSCFCSQKMIACCCRLEVLSTRSSCMTHQRLLKN